MNKQTSADILGSWPFVAAHFFRIKLNAEMYVLDCELLPGFQLVEAVADPSRAKVYPKEIADKICAVFEGAYPAASLIPATFAEWIEHG